MAPVGRVAHYLTFLDLSFLTCDMAITVLILPNSLRSLTGSLEKLKSVDKGTNVDHNAHMPSVDINWYDLSERIIWQYVSKTSRPFP